MNHIMSPNEYFEIDKYWDKNFRKMENYSKKNSNMEYDNKFNCYSPLPYIHNCIGAYTPSLYVWWQRT